MSCGIGFSAMQDATIFRFCNMPAICVSFGGLTTIYDSPGARTLGPLLKGQYSDAPTAESETWLVAEISNLP